MQNTEKTYVLGIDIGSTTVKIAILDSKHEVVFSDYRRHYANIQGTLAAQLSDAFEKIGEVNIIPMITGSGGLTLSQRHLRAVPPKSPEYLHNVCDNLRILHRDCCQV